MIWRDFEVVIIGYDPVGATLANLLGQYGISTGVFDSGNLKTATTHAVHFDDESMRIFQYLGLEDAIGEASRAASGTQYLGKKGEVLFEVRKGDPSDYANGYAPHNLIHTPELQNILHAGLSRYEHVEVLHGYEVSAVTQAGEEISVKGLNKAEQQAVYAKAQYVIACDHINSTARLSTGLRLQNMHYDQQWLIVDATLREPVPLPDVMQQLCDPKRPATYFPLPGNRRRWEFMLKEDEAAEAIQAPDSVYRLLSDWGVDPSKLSIDHTEVLRFHAIVAKDWHRSNVFIAGEAAHEQPPLLAQNLGSGLRDAQNLAWKLNLVKRGLAAPALLSTYGKERGQQVEAVINLATGVSSVLESQNPLASLMRNSFFSSLSKEGNANEIAIPDLESGFLGGDSPQAAGSLFPQPKVRTEAGENVLLDKVLGTGFALVGMNKNPQHVLMSAGPRTWQKLAPTLVHVVPAGTAPSTEEGVVTVSDVDGKLQAWFEKHDATFAFIRPDRYTFGVYSAETLNGLPGQAESLLTGQTASTVQTKKSKRGLASIGLSALGAGLAAVKMWARDELDD